MLIGYARVSTPEQDLTPQLEALHSAGPALVIDINGRLGDEVEHIAGYQGVSYRREVTTLGRTLKKRAADILAYFDRPGTSNGPTEALNGRLEHLRGSALGFRNLTHYIARSLLETGGFRPRLHRGL